MCIGKFSMDKNDQRFNPVMGYQTVARCKASCKKFVKQHWNTLSNESKGFVQLFQIDSDTFEVSYKICNVLFACQSSTLLFQDILGHIHDICDMRQNYDYTMRKWLYFYKFEHHMISQNIEYLPSKYTKMGFDKVKLPADIWHRLKEYHHSLTKKDFKNGKQINL